MKKILIVLVSVLFAVQLNAQTGVSISSTNADPDNSAMLDVQSTTKGFLPPRMTEAERDLIANPATGLMIFQTDGTAGFYYNAGTPAAAAWTAVSATASEPTYTVGLNEALGGYVFFVTLDGKHGLVCETQDQATANNWYTAQDEISDPANHSTAGKNFTDWRLPTKYELNLMYAAKGATDIGPFAAAWYWSSTEYDYSNAWVQHFSGGVQASASKTGAIYNRAVRAF